MNLEAKRHNSNYIFVYVPDSTRYISFPKTPPLKKAMDLISTTDNGPKNQFPSMGCSIKWFK